LLSCSRCCPAHEALQLIKLSHDGVQLQGLHEG
jgi:hypothetical protein